jgi:hypothetical protein
MIMAKKTNDDVIFELADELLSRVSASTTCTNSDETFSTCLICKDVDSHENWCWVPTMKKWFESQTTPVYTAKPRPPMPKQVLRYPWYWAWDTSQSRWRRGKIYH